VGYRFLAILIDGIILAIANVAVGMILGAFSVARPPATDPLGVLFGTYNFANFLLGFLYQVAFIANRGATPGKMAMGLKVVTADGGPISYGRAIGRYFAQILDAFTLLIGYLIAFFDDERRTLHDRICGTRVITVR
jgi:uncharacterized RDD family membrane protein YckC